MEEIGAKIKVKKHAKQKGTLNLKTTKFQFPLLGRGVGVRLNKETTVQVSDTTMMTREQKAGNKRKK